MRYVSAARLGLVMLLGASSAFASIISGSVFNDLNGDGSSDGGTDPTLSGYTVDLFSSSNNLLATTTTDGSGAYSFPGVVQGDYSVAVQTPSGWVDTTPAGGSYSFTLSSDKTGLDFGEFQTVSVSGNVYNDLNNNGQHNAGELGLNGRTVNVVDNGSQVVASATTDASGNYTVTGVGPGSFTLREVVLPGWIVTQPTNPSYYSFTSSSGVNVVGGIFGNFAAAVVPEPATLALLGLGLSGIVLTRRRTQ